MIDQNQLRSLIETVTARMRMNSPSATNLLMGTAAQESLLGTYIKQLGSGPARGIFQMEPATEQDIWDNYLAFRPEIVHLIMNVCERSRPGPWLEYDLAYQICMARIHYYRVKESLPTADDVTALALYWKHHYNTSAGKGSVEEFIENYKLTQ